MLTAPEPGWGVSLRSRAAASMAVAIRASIGGMICAPSLQNTLRPLSEAGLWLAVTHNPAPSPCLETAQATNGVGTGPAGFITLMP